MEVKRDRFQIALEKLPEKGGNGMPTFEYRFPAIRGIQAGREYYASMCPLRLIPRIFLFDEEELKPEVRSQRILNRARIPEMARYIVNNPKDYTFSAITASIDGDVTFEAIGSEGSDHSIGTLKIPMSAKFVINDGQHRRAAIEEALHQSPELGDETISVVFFIDVGLKTSQQMFADLNRHAIRPTPSIGLLYDHRDEDAQVAKAVARKTPIFAELTEMERSSISNRSVKLFTLSGIHNATNCLLAGLDLESLEARVETAVEFWQSVAAQIPDWQLTLDRKVSAADLRRDYVHSHALGLAALARVGNSLLRQQGPLKGKGWKTRIKKLRSLDWSRGNSELWEGRAMNAGRLSKRSVNVTLTGNAIKQHLGIDLSPSEIELEEEFRSNRNGNKKRAG